MIVLWIFNMHVNVLMFQWKDIVIGPCFITSCTLQSEYYMLSQFSTPSCQSDLKLPAAFLLNVLER